MKKSDDEFIVELYNATYHIVFGICLRKTNNYYDAENCSSIVFVKVIESVDVLVSHENPKGWIYRTAYNTLKEYFKKKNFINCLISIEENGNLGIREESFENDIINDESYNNLLNCLYEKLGIKHSDLFRSIYILNMSTDELAKKYGTTKDNVYMRKTRLKEKIKKAIKKC